MFLPDLWEMIQNHNVEENVEINYEKISYYEKIVNTKNT